MSRRAIHILLFAVCLLGSLVVDAANASVSLNDIAKWDKLPTDSLCAMAMRYMNERNMPDSALLCLTIITNRFYDKKPVGKECDYYVISLHDTGYLYLYYYGDLFKAHTYFLQAKEAAEKYKVNKMLSYVYLNLANLFLADKSVNEREPDYCQVINMYKKALNVALQSDQMNSLQPIFINMVQVAFGEDMMDWVWAEVEQYNRLPIPKDAYMQRYGHELCQAMLLWRAGNRDESIKMMGNITIDPELPANEQIHLETIAHDILYHANLFMGRYGEALAQIRKMEAIAGGDDDAAAMADVYHYYHDFYSAQGNHTLADKYELLWLRQRDEAAGQTRIHEMKNAEFLMEISKLNDQIKSLFHQRKMQRTLLAVISSFLLFAIVMVTLLVVNYRKLKRSNRHLYEKNQELIAVEEGQQLEVDKIKYRSSQLDEDSVDELFAQVTHAMRSTDEIFQESFNIARLAEIVGAKQHHISQVINSKTGKSFSSLLAEYRIKEACRRMQDVNNYGNFTIEAIGQSVGLKSRPYFVQLFKKYTGLTPSAYQKMARDGA